MKRLINHSLLAALLALSCGAAFAQGPASQEKDPAATGGKPAAKAEMKSEAKKGDTSTMGAGHAKMDADGDGMVTKSEWDSYHSAMWKKMNKNGKVSMADMETAMKGGPN
jgi:hypothetical protein